MGSHPTLDHHEFAAEAQELDPDDWSHRHAVAHLAADHPQVRAWPDDNPYLAHDQDHRDWIYDHPHPSTERGRRGGLRPAQPRLRRFRRPARPLRPPGRPGPRDRPRPRGAGGRPRLRQNDRNPVIWQPSQDYRAADAIQAARTQPTRARYGPERLATNVNHHRQGQH
jgi:hypothetical protein